MLRKTGGREERSRKLTASELPTSIFPIYQTSARTQYFRATKKNPIFFDIAQALKGPFYRVTRKVNNPFCPAVWERKKSRSPKLMANWRTPKEENYCPTHLFPSRKKKPCNVIDWSFLPFFVFFSLPCPVICLLWCPRGPGGGEIITWHPPLFPSFLTRREGGDFYV